MTREELKLFKQGNEDVFARVVTDNRDYIYRVIVSVIGNRPDAEDLCQETFVKAYTSLGSFAGSASVSTWLYRIAYNTALDYLRKNGNKPIAEDIEDAAFHGLKSDCGAEPESVLEQKELRAALRAALYELPEEQRIIIELRDVQGFAYEEIAKIMRLREGTVKSRISRARENLRKIILKSGNFF